MRDVRRWLPLALSTPAIFALLWEALGGWHDTLALNVGTLICETYPAGRWSIIALDIMPLACLLGLSLGLSAMFRGHLRMAAICFLAIWPWILGPIYIFGIGKIILGPESPC